MTDPDLENHKIEILIVEDSPTQAEELKYTLNRHNFTVLVACNGSEALSMIRERKPTMVISDIVMPEMDGYQLCREIKNDGGHKDLPVILLTTLSDPRDVVRGLECGADNFITKPYAEKYILSRIHYVLANKHLQDLEQTQLGIEILLAGEKYFIKSDRIQILNLLLSSYETATQKNGELIKARDELNEFNKELEKKVKERTAALVEEISERKQAEVERERLIIELRDTFEKVKTLSGLVPICSCCKKIRDDKGYWTQLEVYISEHSGAEFTHGLCPECAEKMGNEVEKISKLKQDNLL